MAVKVFRWAVSVSGVRRDSSLEAVKASSAMSTVAKYLFL